MGAAGSVHSIVLALAEAGFAGVVGNAVYDALRSLIAHHREALRDEDVQPYGPDADEVEHRARWHIVEAFGLRVETDALELIGSVHNLLEGRWRVDLRHESWEYVVTIEKADGLVELVEIERRRA